YDAVEKEGKRLGDVLTGYLDTNEVEVVPDPVVEESTSDEAVVDEEEEVVEGGGGAAAAGATEEEETVSGPDPELAKNRFEELRKQLKSTERALKKYG